MQQYFMKILKIFLLFIDYTIIQFKKIIFYKDKNKIFSNFKNYN